MMVKDVQLLEFRKWQVEDIVRVFGVLNYMINFIIGLMFWGSGIEQMSIGFVIYMLQLYFNWIEGELNRKLFQGLIFVEYSVVGLMCGDYVGCFDYYLNVFGGIQVVGWMIVNEVWCFENFFLLKEGGDRIYVLEFSNGLNEFV